jgi:outer membrane protein assembly factor BamB
LAALILIGGSGVAAFATPRPQDAALPTEWDQPHGNAAGTAFVDVAPLKVPPTERWRFKSEQVLAGPVVSQGKVYAVVREGKARKLVALDPNDGALLGRKTLECTGDVLGLAVVERLAAVVDPQNVRTYRFVGDAFRNEKTFAGGYVGEPTMVHDLVLVSGGAGRGLLALDGASGKEEVVDVDGTGRAMVVRDSSGDELLLHLVLSSSGAAFGFCRSNYLGVRGKKLAQREDGKCSLTFVGGTSLAARCALISATSRLEGDLCFWMGGAPQSGVRIGARCYPVPLLLPPATREGRAYGYTADGVLVLFDFEKSTYLPLIQKAELPKGALTGAPSIARDVLYLGNWAVELGSRRVLWCLDALAAVGPLIPSGDEAFVATTADGTLVGYGNGVAPAKPGPKSAAVGGAGAGAKSKSSASAAAPAPVATMPGAKPGVVRADGVYLLGNVSALDGGRFRVETGAGAPQEFEAGALAWAATAPDAKVLNDQYPVYRACYAALEAQYVEVLLAQYQQWKQLSFFDECRRLLDEAKRYGLAPARADELIATIAGRKSTTAGNADVQRKHLQEVEGDARVAFVANIVAAAQWCADHGAKTAASALRLRVADMIPGRAVDPATIADWAPPDFPGIGTKTEIGKTWALWADALLPSGAHFVKADEALTKRLSKSPFSSGAKILATDHVLLISREWDPKILGPCLSRAEATVRTLTRMLGKSPSAGKPDATIEVHLYVTREEYLADKSSGWAPPQWSAGVYSPSEAVSRFYSRLAADAEDPFGRSLHSVMAHELTHHFVDRVWNPASNPSVVPGFWMVEGFAEFVGEQAVEMDRLGDALDDATVRSLDMTAAAMRAGHFIPLAVLLDIDHEKFRKELDGPSFGPLQLRHTLFRCKLDPRGLFYVESAALSFFVMNRCGENGRATYIDWFARLCRAETVPEMWKQVGFASLAEFEAAFKAFLQGL